MKKLDLTLKKFILTLQEEDEQEILNLLELEGVADFVNINFHTHNQGEYEKIEIPLHIALERNQFAVIKKLIELGANIDDRNSIGETPLHVAINSQNEQVVKFLLGCNANVHLCNKLDETPYGIASRHIVKDYSTVSRNITSYLIHAGANAYPVEVKNINYTTKIVEFFPLSFIKRVVADHPLLCSSIDKMINQYLSPISLSDRHTYYDRVVTYVRENALNDYKVKIKSAFTKAENIFYYSMELAKTSLSTLAIVNIVGYLDRDNSLHATTLSNLQKSVEAILLCKKSFCAQINKDEEHGFEKLNKAIKDHSLKNILHSQEQQKHFRKDILSLNLKESFAEQMIVGREQALRLSAMNI